MAEWAHSHETLLWWLAAASLVTFVATLVIVPWLVVRIPPDYFLPKKRRRRPRTGLRRMRHWALLTVRNVLGYALVAAGIPMLPLPGQGLLTILIGITLLSFPGKYRLERWVVTRKPVLRSVNWLRRRAGKSPFEFGG